MTVPYSNETVANPNFFQQYFIDPIINYEGYNIVNTPVYGILIVIASFIIYKFLKKLGYKIDMRLLKAVTPFVLAVGVWRVLTDAGVYPYGFLTSTPGLYIPVLSIFFPLIILAKKLEDYKGWRYDYLFGGVSLVLLASQVIIMATLMQSMIHFDRLGMSLFYTIISCAPLMILSRYWIPLKNKFNLLMLVSHFFEASVTHVSIAYYNYIEQHVIPNFIFELFNSSLSFYAWKALVLGVVIYLLDYVFKDKSKDNIELNNFVKIIFIIYGLTIGVRNLLRLIIGV